MFWSLLTVSVSAFVSFLSTLSSLARVSKLAFVSFLSILSSLTRVAWLACVCFLSTLLSCSKRALSAFSDFSLNLSSWLRKLLTYLAKRKHWQTLRGPHIITLSKQSYVWLTDFLIVNSTLLLKWLSSTYKSTST